MLRIDGSMYDGFHDRQLVVTISRDAPGGGASSGDAPGDGASEDEDKQIVPGDNILVYTVDPGSEASRVLVRVMERVDEGSGGDWQIAAMQ